MIDAKAFLALALNWQKTEESPYVFATTVRGEVIKLRLNDFPEEPLCTLIFGGREVDLDDLGPNWTLPKHRVVPPVVSEATAGTDSGGGEA